jgi:hypothetical protein
MFSSMSYFGRIPFYFLSSIILLILARFPFGPKKDSNWPAIGLQTLSILQLSLQTWTKIFLAAGIPAFTLDIHTTLGSKRVYTISSTWGPKLSNNTGYGK